MKIAHRRFKRGHSKVAKDDYAEIILQFDKEIEINPKIASAYLGRGMIKNFTANHEITFLDFSRSPVADHFDTELYSQANFSQTSPNPQPALAIADFDKAIEINPAYAKAYFIRGIVRSCLYQDSKSRDPNNYKLKKPENFPHDNLVNFADFDKAIEVDPQFAEAYYTRGLAKSYQHHKNGNRVDSTARVESATDLTSTSSIQGYLLHNQAVDYSGAIADFDKAISINPEFADAYYCRGLAKNLLQNSVGKPGPKISKNIPAENPKRSHNGKSELNYHFKKLEGIIADYDSAIKINPGHSNAYYSRGLVKLVFQDQWEKMKQAIANNRTVSEHTKYSLPLTNGKEGLFKNYLGAITDFDRAIQINPFFANAFCHRGLARFCCNDLSGAVTDMKKAIEIDPVNKEVYRKIASCIGLNGLQNKKFMN